MFDNFFIDRVLLSLDTIIVQVQVGAQPLMQQVLLNGVAFTGTSQEVNSIIQSIMADALLPLLISFNQTIELGKCAMAV